MTGFNVKTLYFLWRWRIFIITYLLFDVYFNIFLTCALYKNDLNLDGSFFLISVCKYNIKHHSLIKHRLIIRVIFTSVKWIRYQPISTHDPLVNTSNISPLTFGPQPYIADSARICYRYCYIQTHRKGSIS